MAVVPAAHMRPLLAVMVRGGEVDDKHMVTAVGNMMGWLAWPRDTGVDAWILGLIQELAQQHRFPVLLEAVAQFSGPLLKLLSEVPASRRGVVAVLSSMLLSHQSSCALFHSLLPGLPAVIEQLRAENDPALPALAAVLHTLMFHFEGYPELYQPLLEARSC